MSAEQAALTPANQRRDSRVGSLGDLREAHGPHPPIRDRLRGHLQGAPVSKRNYGYEKRQKELNRQRRQEEKRQRKLDKSGAPPEDGQEDQPPSPGESPEAE